MPGGRPRSFNRRSSAAKFRHDQHRRVLAAIAEEHGFGNERAAFEDRFDRLRRDLLPAGGDEQILLSIGNRQVAFRIDVPDVAGVEPSVLQHIGGRLRLVEVAAHDVRAAGQDLAVVRDPQLHAGNRAANRANAQARSPD